MCPHLSAHSVLSLLRQSLSLLIANVVSPQVSGVNYSQDGSPRKCPSLSSGIFVVALAESELAKRVRWSETLVGVNSEKVERIKARPLSR